MSVRNSEDVREKKIAAGQVILNGSDGAVLEEHATERQLAQVLGAALPPLKCVGQVWYVYENGCWKKTDRNLYKPLALKIQHERSRKARRAEGVLSHVEFEHQIEQASLRSFHYMTQAGEILLNCQNGILCVTEKEVKIRPHVQECNFTGQIAAAYEPAAGAPIFNRVLNDALPDQNDVLLFQVFTGSILLPDSRFEATLVCYGPTGTAKSTLASGIKAALGADIITNLTLQQICDPKCFHLHKLQSAAVNIATELNALAVSSENFKRIVSGEALDADRKYLNSVNLETSCKLWFLTNELPKFVSGTDAELRRLRFLRFIQRDWTVDTSLKARIQNEKNGVFTFMVDGLRKALPLSEMPFGSENSIKARERFKVQNDPLGAFIDACCVLDPDKEESKDYLSNAYNDFCRENGIPAPASPEPFFRKLYERYPVQSLAQQKTEFGFTK